jgi:hypothetical protein
MLFTEPSKSFRRQKMNSPHTSPDGFSGIVDCPNSENSSYMKDAYKSENYYCMDSINPALIDLNVNSMEERSMEFPSFSTYPSLIPMSTGLTNWCADNLNEILSISANQPQEQFPIPNAALQEWETINGVGQSESLSSESSEQEDYHPKRINKKHVKRRHSIGHHPEDSEYYASNATARHLDSEKRRRIAINHLYQILESKAGFLIEGKSSKAKILHSTVSLIRHFKQTLGEHGIEY